MIENECKPMVRQPMVRQPFDVADCKIDIQERLQNRSKKLSTCKSVHVLLTLIENWKKSKDENLFAGAVLMDFHGIWFYNL